MSSNSTDIASSVDVVLIGGGVMSATLGTLLRQLQPDWKISIYERLDTVAEESSNAWNNAGTGHSACASSTTHRRVLTERSIFPRQLR